MLGSCQTPAHHAAGANAQQSPQQQQHLRDLSQQRYLLWHCWGAA